MLNSLILTLDKSCDIIVGSISQAVYRKILLIEGETVNAAKPVHVAAATNAVVVNPVLVNEFQLIVKTILLPKYIFLFSSIRVSLNALRFTWYEISVY